MNALKKVFARYASNELIESAHGGTGRISGGSLMSNPPVGILVTQLPCEHPGKPLEKVPWGGWLHPEEG